MWTKLFAINGGSLADILTAGGSYISGGYTGAFKSAGVDNDGLLAGRQAWHGKSNGYICTVLALLLAGINQSILLRWRMGSDHLTT